MCVCVSLSFQSSFDFNYITYCVIFFLFFKMCFAFVNCSFKKVIEVGRMEGVEIGSIKVWGRWWAVLLILKISFVGLFNLDESEEDEDDLLQRTGNFISTSTSLPRGILKVRVYVVGTYPVIYLWNSVCLPVQMYGFLLCVGLSVLAVIFALVTVLVFSFLLWNNQEMLNYVSCNSRNPIWLSLLYFYFHWWQLPYCCHPSPDLLQWLCSWLILPLPLDLFLNHSSCSSLRELLKIKYQVMSLFIAFGTFWIPIIAYAALCDLTSVHVVSFIADLFSLIPFLSHGGLFCFLHMLSLFLPLNLCYCSSFCLSFKHC